MTSRRIWHCEGTFVYEVPFPFAAPFEGLANLLIEHARLKISNEECGVGRIVASHPSRRTLRHNRPTIPAGCVAKVSIEPARHITQIGSHPPDEIKMGGAIFAPVQASAWRGTGLTAFPSQASRPQAYRCNQQTNQVAVSAKC